MLDSRPYSLVTSALFSLLPPLPSVKSATSVASCKITAKYRHMRCSQSHAMQAPVSEKRLSKLRDLASFRRLAGFWQRGLFALRAVWMKIGHRGRIAAVAVAATAFLAVLVLVKVREAGGPGGGSTWQSAEIADVTRTTTLTLIADPRLKSVDQLVLRIRGNIDGAAQIAGAPLRPKRVSGKFDVTDQANHREPTCVISYMPVGVRKGKVNVEYQFRERQRAAD